MIMYQFVEVVADDRASYLESTTIRSDYHMFSFQSMFYSQSALKVAIL